MLSDCEGTPDVIVIATGSEVGIAVEAAAASSKRSVSSMPCTSVFDAQDAAYKESVLPSTVTARVAVEAAVTDGWWKYVGTNGKVVGSILSANLHRPASCSKLFGFTAANVGAAIDEVAG